MQSMHWHCSGKTQNPLPQTLVKVMAERLPVGIGWHALPCFSLPLQKHALFSQSMPWHCFGMTQKPVPINNFS
jgi:hypothetical protein